MLNGVGDFFCMTIMTNMTNDSVILGRALSTNKGLIID